MVACLVVGVVAIAAPVLMYLCGRGVVRRNPFAGIRIASFFASEQNWQTGHRAAVLPTAIAAVVCLGATVVVIIEPRSLPIAIGVELGSLLAGLIIGTILGSRAIRRS
jgi:hypothetical protein